MKFYIWKAKSTSKTQRLILIYTKVNIFFILTLGIHNFSLNNRQAPKLPPHWEHLSKLRSKDATATRTSKKKSFTTHNHNSGCASHFWGFLKFFMVFSISWGTKEVRGGTDNFKWNTLIESGKIEKFKVKAWGKRTWLLPERIRTAVGYLTK